MHTQGNCRRWKCNPQMKRTVRGARVPLTRVTHEEDGGGGGLAINYSKPFCRAEPESPVHKMRFHVFLY